MERASLFLKRFKNLKAPERSVKEVVVQVVYEVAQVHITPQELKVSGPVVFILVHSAVRAHIFQYKQLLISRINNLLGNERVTDIR